MTSPSEFYKGWKITHTPNAPSAWRADRYGVGMCSNTCAGLAGMIDLHEKDRLDYYENIIEERLK